jgi:transmembrane protein TMEM260 (protein O-mannosyltransferase)
VREELPTRRVSVERAAALTAGAALLGIYLASLAPDVTFWDAGEFIAAAQTLGIPHPPGTPLYILVAHVWRLLLGALPPAIAVNVFSAVCTAVAGLLTAAVVSRATGVRAHGIAAALAAGTMSTVWLNATETEVYAVSLSLSVLMLWVGDRAGRTADPRWVVLTGYLIALAAPLHVSALVAAPGAALLAASDADGRVDPAIALALTAVGVLSGGVGTGSVAVTVMGVLALAGVAAWSPARRLVPRLALVSVCAFSVLAFLLLRAKHDPAINQGNPSTLEALWELVARRQYAVAPLWPRQAPFWLQVGNLLEYADWQVGLGLAPLAPPSPWRTPLTIGAIVLAMVGARAHRARDPRTWRAQALVLLCATVGVLAYLNLKAGPSIGYGILADSAPHEARERDYFFALGFWIWGVWMGMGAVEVVSRRRESARPLGVALAAAPLFLNWSAVNRRREPDASAAAVVARSLLEHAPARAVLLVAGDNDTYPLWYLQQARGVRQDVTVVTLPLLGADWYREELSRRHALVGEPVASHWMGIAATVRDVGAHAAAGGRPVVASPSLTEDERDVLPGWEMAGSVFRWTGAPEPRSRGDSASMSADTATRSAAARAAEWMHAHNVTRFTDHTTASMRLLVGCPVWAIAADTSAAAADSLASLCNFR